MKAQAPGKLVLSGAYAILEGAPAVVAAVDRYVVADTRVPAELVTPEVRAALGDRAAPWFDASPLRDERGKLGLGSSAAILVASLAALELEAAPSLSSDALRSRVLEPALAAHRAAQGGGSGIDVLASTLGGVVVARRLAGALSSAAVELPAGLHIEVWFSGQPASTGALLQGVKELRDRDRGAYARLMSAQSEASEAAAAALAQSNTKAFLEAAQIQQRALDALGRAAGAAIVTAPARELHDEARESGAVALPSGAGGGDALLHLGVGPSTSTFRARAVRLGHRSLALKLGAAGVHSLPLGLSSTRIIPK